MILSQTLFRGRVPAATDPIEDEFEKLDPTVRIGSEQPLFLTPQIPLESIQELGPYRLLRQLGSGGMGIVFEAEEVATGETFAVKVLRPTLIMEADAKLRFFREAQAMASIAHQRIVPVVRVGEDQGIPYIAMPLLLGETLEERLQHGPELTLEHIVRIGIEIAEGLDAAHRHSLIHRDVKPANVWLEEPFGGVRLLDLGLVREITKDTLLTNSGIVMGTPSYMSPEQARGEKLDARSDLFGLGCILYQMSVGTRPFDGPTPLNTMQQLDQYHPPRVSARNPAVPAMLSNLIMELLAKHPKDRPASAADVMERLRRIPLHEPVRPACSFGSNPSIDLAQQANAQDPFEADEQAKSPIGNWIFGSLSVLLVAAFGFLFLSMR